MNRRDLLLAVLAASEGQPYTPVQIQKSLFLVSRNLPGVVTEGPAFNFAPYDYGPFDSAVYAEADALEATGLASITRPVNGRWRNYGVTEEGLVVGRRILDGLTPDQRNYVTSVSEWVRKLSFASLVKSIYEAYPEMRENSVFQG